MEIKDILSLDCVACAVEATSKKRILHTISQLASEKLSDISTDDVLTSLVCREKMGSTGIGGGIAIPHGRLNKLDKTMAIVVTSKAPVDFDAIDNQAVDVFFTLLVPAGQNDGHLQTLATIAKTLSNKSIIKQMRKATDNQSLFEVLQ